MVKADGWMKGWEPWGALGSSGGCMWGVSRHHRAEVWPQEHLHQGPGMGFDFWLSPYVRKALLFWDEGLLGPPYPLNYCVIC